MLLLAGLHAALSSIMALYIYTFFYCSISSAMVVSGVILFILCWIFGPIDGMLWKWKRKFLHADSLDLSQIED